MSFTFKNFWQQALATAPLLTAIFLSFDKADILPLAFALCVLLNAGNQKCSMAQTKIGLVLYQACLDKKVSSTHSTAQKKKKKKKKS